MQFLSNVRRMANTKLLHGVPVIILPLVFQSNAVAITVKSQPSSRTVTLGKSIKLHLNARASPVGGGDIVYKWYKNGQKLKASGDTLTINSASEYSEGVYDCVVRDSVSVYHCKKFRISVVSANLHITKQPQSHTAYIGRDIGFSVNVSHENDVHYQWYHDSKAIKNGDRRKLSIKGVNWADAGRYRVVVSESGSSKKLKSKSVYLRVHPFERAQITQQPKSVTVTNGHSAEFSVNAKGSGKLLYEWFFNGKPIHGENDSTLRLSHVNADDAGNYKVVVHNRDSSDESRIVALKIDTSVDNVTITRQPSNQFVSEGSDVKLSVSAESTDAMHYQWFFNGDAIKGATDRTLVLNNVNSGDKGKYHVTVKSGSAVVSSDKAQIAILASSQENYTAELQWNRPTKREDGETLFSREIANYNVYYSNQRIGSMSRIATVGPTVYKYVVRNLGEGTHYFALSTVDDEGLESSLSEKVRLKY